VRHRLALARPIHKSAIEILLSRRMASRRSGISPLMPGGLTMPLIGIDRKTFAQTEFFWSRAVAQTSPVAQTLLAPKDKID
jgi:hypothetical protein